MLQNIDSKTDLVFETSMDASMEAIMAANHGW